MPPRTRDRSSAQGLLPLMEARPWKDGKTVTYRYHPLGGKPINPGTDREAAIRRVLDLNGEASDAGTVDELWRRYQEHRTFLRLAPGTQAAYRDHARPLLAVFGRVAPAAVTAAHVQRYLEIERHGKPVANKEVALLSNLMRLGVVLGRCATNPAARSRATPAASWPRRPTRPRWRPLSPGPGPEVARPASSSAWPRWPRWAATAAASCARCRGPRSTRPGRQAAEIKHLGRRQFQSDPIFTAHFSWGRGIVFQRQEPTRRAPQYRGQPPDGPADDARRLRDWPDTGAWRVCSGTHWHCDQGRTVVTGTNSGSARGAAC